MEFCILMLEPPVLALDIYHSSWRNSLPFTSLRSVTVGSGRDFLEGAPRRAQAHGLLEPADPHPDITAAAAHFGATSVEVHAVRGEVVPWATS